MVRRVLTLPSLTLVGSLLLGTGLPAESEQSVLPLEVAARTAARKDAARTLIPLLRHVRQRATAATEVRPGSTPNSPFTGTQTSLFVFTVGKRSVPVDPAAVEAMDRLLRWKVGDPNATDDAALFDAWLDELALKSTAIGVGNDPATCDATCVVKRMATLDERWSPSPKNRAEARDEVLLDALVAAIRK
ncbi:MAG: penicillin acylase family protein [Vicinamibacterales bacterium]